MDKSLADTIIKEAKSHEELDREDSVYLRFSQICARIVGNDSVRFLREGKLLSNKEIAIEESLNIPFDKANHWAEESLVSPYILKKLTPAQQEWVKETAGMGDWGCEMSLPHVDNDVNPGDAWDPSEPVTNPSQSGPVA